MLEEQRKDGGRKLRESRETALMMLIGLGIAVYFKASAEIYGLYVLGLTGKSASFMWGNAKEHQAVNKPA